LWLSDPNATPQDRSFSLANLLAYLQTKPFVTVVSLAGGNVFTAFTKDTRVIETAAGTVDITAGASAAGIRVEIVNKYAAGITLNVSTGAASLTMGVGAIALEWDGTQWQKIGGMTFTQVFSSGTGATWKAPWGGSYKVTGVGGGGGGGATSESTNYQSGGGGGGGGGGAAIKTYYEAAAATFTYTVGGGGATGVAGGNTTVTDGTLLVTGAGGGAGGSGAAGQVGGSGGAGTNGDLNVKGNGGVAPFNFVGTISVNGLGMGGAGGGSLLGGGAPGGTTAGAGGTTGAAGGNYGGGGAGGSANDVTGAQSANGGAGGGGVVVIEF